MRLVDLDPHWFTRGDSPDLVGVTFKCPCCRRIRIGVLFVQEIDMDSLPNDVHWAAEGEKWDRAGETFDTLTLSPSIDGSAYGHWHGFVRGGEVT